MDVGMRDHPPCSMIVEEADTSIFEFRRMGPAVALANVLPRFVW